MVPTLHPSHPWRPLVPGGCRQPPDALNCRFTCFFVPHATDLALFAEGYFSLSVCGPFQWHFLTKNIHFSLEPVCSRGMTVQLAGGCQTPLPGKALNQGAPVSPSRRGFVFFLVAGWRGGGSPVTLKQVNKQKWAKNETPRWELEQGVWLIHSVY